MNDNKESMIGNREFSDDWDDSSLSGEDRNLMIMMGEYLKAELDFEAVKDDPGYKEAERKARLIVTDSYSCKGKDSDRKYISEALLSFEQEENLRDEIKKIKAEIKNNRVNDISSEWVREWHQKMQGTDKKTDEVKEELLEYISSSLEKHEAVEYLPELPVKKSIRRSLVVRYISLAAAVVTGSLIIFTTLVPGDDPVKIFNKYYDPEPAVSMVTRGTTLSETDIWEKAIDDYNTGNYISARDGFSLLNDMDAQSSAQRYYLGMTFIGLEDYKQAASLLSGVAEEQAEFAMEAKWYLGLVYLRLGDIKKASEYFEILAESPGYYSERASDILRRIR